MDIDYLLLLQDFRIASGGFLNQFFSFITEISVGVWIWFPIYAVFWAVDKRKGTIVLMSYGIANLINAPLKLICCVYRPWIRSPLVTPDAGAMAGATGYSFPSGHSSSMSGVCSGVFAAYRGHRMLGAFCVLMMLLAMFSRNYLGVHTPQDVAAGALTGVVGSIAALKIAGWLDGGGRRDSVLLAVISALSIIAAVYISVKSYPADYGADGKLIVDSAKMAVDGYKDLGRVFGIAAGWFIERRYVGFDASAGTAEQKFLRCAFGLLLMAFFEMSVVAHLGAHFNSGAAWFLLRASMPVLFLAGYPALFRSLRDFNG